LRLVLHPYAGLLEGRLEPLPVPVEPYLLVPRPHPLAGRRGDPILAHKGLGGPWGAEILASAQHLGAADALLLWSDGTLAETAIAAVGLERDGVFTLPPPPGRVASLAVQLDLPVWAAARGLRIAEAALTPAQALAGRLWCMNALRGIWPATLL
jgi:branched-subunit amino acid aminotransferase/4-amino-4-deoxychorismate lyase